ncbi:WASP homolog-associated protein with actin, membranes and microtubules [Corythoichthys intestinalis]|uniref:WASP homolog-associated protein with actin, membranes and microtubules n=1 Tax=Corythoichthys intestinalis TaxID=161448 RepID=UPI0025A527AF|nr:WASP homolog-associated protein with actin, membranes and microtubules [Corythoichthys intestinalis]XP_061795929.1 WASP homolog-associated protein with actin, membranes and microtubules [Nerophis lumbriciformis]
MSTVDCERPDSLDEWVAVKSNIFEEAEVFKLGFIVQWNVIECKFAVTCHNRTLQRRRRKEEFGLAGGLQSSWAGLFSVNDLKHIHQHLTCVSDVLAACFPDLSDFEDGNIWDLLFPSRKCGSDDAQRDSDAPCRKLEKYFSTAIDVCGRTIVLDTLFSQDEKDVDDYFENLQEFKRKSMHDEMSRAKDHLRQLLQSHDCADRMVALLAIYAQEDEAYQELVTEATSFFQYLLQPFRDIRELACLYKMEILKSMELDDLGPKRIEALEREAEEWRAKAEDAVASIQDITVTYFAQTSKALTGMVKQMEEDKHRFGAAAWASAAPRLEKLRVLLAKEALQHMRSTEMCLNRKKASIKKEFVSLYGKDRTGTGDSGSASDQNSLDRLELQFYETQLELYNTKFEILKNEEQLLVTQTDSLRRQIRELKEEVVYYDVCEDPEELHSMVHTGLQHTEPPAVRQLKRRLQNLETKRGAICAQRARLRNKKDQCVEAHEQKQLAAEQKSMVFAQHHQVHLKREKKKEEEQRRKQWVDQEREKTLSRLRSFREKQQGQYVLKTSQYRKSTKKSSPPTSQPLSLINLSPSLTSDELPSIRAAPSLKYGQPGDLPVEIFFSSPPPYSGAVMSPPTRPPPPPPPPPLPPMSTSHEEKPMPLREKSQLPARNTLTQNIGTMDEVLASLQRLRKASVPGTPPPPPAGDPRSNLMLAIRQGVTLKKVLPSPSPSGIHVGSHDNELEKSIRAAMMRMKKVAADSDDDDDDYDGHNGDWDS